MSSPGGTPPLVLRGGRVADLRRHTTVEADVVLRDGLIQRVGPGAGDAVREAEVLDVRGRILAPGFIDSHLHIESSLLTPLEFARAAVCHGTTAVFVDPHEIANVCGRAGIELFLRQAELLPLDLYVGIPSCVPATPLEDAGAAIGLEDIRALLEHPRVYGLGEMMNYPGILSGQGGAREKVALVLARGKLVDGHAPGLRGAPLRRYVSNGRDDGVVRIGSDHESRSADEARDKRQAGMQIALRYGSASKDLPAILPPLLAEGADLAGYMLCSDDLDPVDLLEEGHVDRILRRMQALLQAQGRSAEQAALEAISLGTLHAARYFAPFFQRQGLPPMGEVAPGHRANLVVLKDLAGLEVEQVLHQGRVVAQGGVRGPSRPYDYRPFSGPLHIARSFQPEDFMLRHAGAPGPVAVKVIGLADGIATEAHSRTVQARTGEALQPAGTATLAVIERHHGKGSFALGFVERCLEHGAIASTVAHDSHNVIALGVDPGAMARAVNLLRERGGGMVAVGTEAVHLPLPVAGLMSDQPIETVVAGCHRLRAALRALGADENLFMRMSFLALPVIPELRLTNRGLVDVQRFAFVDVAEPAA